MNSLKQRFHRFRNLLVIDELNESNRFVKFIGSSFIILGIFYCFNIVKISAIILICISLSGIFFIISDIFEHLCKIQNQKKAIDLKKRVKKISYLKLIKMILQLLAIISLIVAPYINLNINSITLSKISNTLSIFAIGLTVIKIGLDNSMKKIEHEQKLADEILQLLESSNDSNNN